MESGEIIEREGGFGYSSIYLCDCKDILGKLFKNNRCIAITYFNKSVSIVRKYKIVRNFVRDRVCFYLKLMKVGEYSQYKVRTKGFIR